MIKHIKSFNQIPITKNSLIVLDIDETIMAFPSITNLWWRETYEKHFEITNDKKIARNLSIYDWREHVKITKPYLLDEIKLKKFLGKIKEKFCALVLLTARDPTMMKITQTHISHCKLDISPEQVIHNENKGDALALIVQSYPEITNIIFVDDFEKNLIDVKTRFACKSMEKYNLTLYQITHK